MAGSRLTLDEIRQAYPDEYVVLVDVDVDDESLLVRGGVVNAHAKSRKDALGAAELPSGAGWALEYTGRPDPGYLLHLKVGCRSSHSIGHTRSSESRTRIDRVADSNPSRGRRPPIDSLRRRIKRGRF